MATDFWVSSHLRRWLVDRELIQRSRAIDRQYVEDPDHLALLDIFFANLLSQLGTKIFLRQRVIATATVFFRRFYLKNSYCETDPYLVLVACLYVAAKAEESPVHIKNVIAEARNLLGTYGIKHFPTDNSKLAEMEFYLVDDLECDLIVFHPYRTLLALVTDLESSDSNNLEKEAGELGTGIDDGRRFWGSGEGRLSLHKSGIQNAWFLINDTYRSDICLLYPPHLIAIAALYLTCVLHPATRQAHLEWASKQEAAANVEESAPQTRRSLRHASNNTSNAGSSASVLTSPQKSEMKSTGTTSKSASPPQDFVGFFAGLNVNMRLVTTIAQEMVSFYALCERYKEDFNSTPNIASSAPSGSSAWTRSAHSHAQAMGTSSRSTSHGSATTPGVDGDSRSTPGVTGSEVDSKTLIALTNKMRAMRELDIAHPPTGRPVAVSRMLERTQG